MKKEEKKLKVRLKKLKRKEMSLRRQLSNVNRSQEKTFSRLTKTRGK